MIAIAFLAASCTEAGPASGPAESPVPARSVCSLPSLAYDAARLFPADGSLDRAEDGLALADGRLIVVDQQTGLRLIEEDGSNRPFGDFAAAGFVNDPETMAAGPNGIAMGIDREYVWVSDVLTGKIYRVSLESERVEMIYDHPYGVNTLTFDHAGNIWFTQSTDNPEGPFDPGWLGDVRDAYGAVYRLDRAQDGYADSAVRQYRGLYFANGITFGNDGKYLYVAETMMDRVLRFPIDASGHAGEPEVFAYVTTPDNIKFDGSGNLWVASPIRNQVVAVSADARSTHVVFHADAPGNRANSEAWLRGMKTGQLVLPLLNADMVAPLPGLLTGLFFSADGRELYIANLGNALLRYEL